MKAVMATVDMDSISTATSEGVQDHDVQPKLMLAVYTCALCQQETDAIVHATTTTVRAFYCRRCALPLQHRCSVCDGIPTRTLRVSVVPSPQLPTTLASAGHVLRRRACSNYRQVSHGFSCNCTRQRTTENRIARI